MPRPGDRARPRHGQRHRGGDPGRGRLSSPLPLVIDADGLTALGDLAAAEFLLGLRSAPTVLTPHDGEYAGLAGSPPGDDRLAAARDLARLLGVTVLLKGPLTAVAAADHSVPDVLLSAAGLPALADGRHR